MINFVNFRALACVAILANTTTGCKSVGKESALHARETSNSNQLVEFARGELAEFLSHAIHNPPHNQTSGPFSCDEDVIGSNGYNCKATMERSIPGEKTLAKVPSEFFLSAIYNYRHVYSASRYPNLKVVFGDRSDVNVVIVDQKAGLKLECSAANSSVGSKCTATTLASVGI